MGQFMLSFSPTQGAWDLRSLEESVEKNREMVQSGIQCDWIAVAVGTHDECTQAQESMSSIPGWEGSR